MAIKYTVPFNLPYPDIDDPVRNGQSAIEGIAKGVNTALQNAEIPPGNPDLNAVLARLNELERHQNYDKQICFTTATPFPWAGQAGWDAGSLIVDTRGYITSQNSPGTPTFAVPGTLSGTIKFNEPGIYDIVWFNVAGGDPGNSGYRIVASGVWPGGMDTASPGNVFGQALHSNGATHWETMIVAVNIRVPVAGLTIRLTGVQSFGTTNEPRIRLTKKSSL